jgi:hypothetical protein
VKKSHLKPEITSSTSASVYAIPTTTTTSTSSSDNVIKTKIENATEGLSLAALAIFLTEYYLHLKRML